MGQGARSKPAAQWWLSLNSSTGRPFFGVPRPRGGCFETWKENAQCNFTSVLASAFFCVFFTRSLRAITLFFTRILLNQCARFLLRSATALFCCRVFDRIFLITFFSFRFFYRAGNPAWPIRHTSRRSCTRSPQPEVFRALRPPSPPIAEAPFSCSKFGCAF